MCIDQLVVHLCSQGYSPCKLIQYKPSGLLRGGEAETHAERSVLTTRKGSDDPAQSTLLQADALSDQCERSNLLNTAKHEHIASSL